MDRIWGQTRNLDELTIDPLHLTQHCSGGRGWRGAQIWGQTRCVLVRNRADTAVPPLIPSPTCGMLRPNTVTGTVFGCPGL